MKALSICIALVLCAFPAQAMTFNVEVIDPRPIEELAYFVYGVGPIVEGDSERLLKALQAKKRSGTERVHVYLHSPGGNLAEGVRLGRLISKIGANTDVGRQSPNSQLSVSGECSSACVLAFLGGNYRYLKKDSKLGVHQFAFSVEKSIESETAVAVTQILAAEIVEFIKQNRADTDFFTLMTRTLPSTVYFVPHEKLRELRVVTDAIWDEEWTFEFAQGTAYLKIWQQSYHGENKLIVSCENRTLIGAAFVQPPNLNALGVMRHTVGIFIDGKLETIPDESVFLHPEIAGRYARALFRITPEMGSRMLVAKSIGTAMQPPNKDIFFGFQTDRTKDRDKLSKMVLGCR